MQIDILTLFPKMFENILGESMMKIARKKGVAKIDIHNLRDWTFDSHKTADDKPFGGGPGMVMKIEPVYLAIKEIVPDRAKARVILMTPQGRRYNQSIAKELSKDKRLLIICGHYEGVDERVRELADDEISIGDYILTCGEIPAMVLIDSIVRLLPGALGKKESLNCESFEGGLLEYPQYTRPAEYEGMRVPEILLNGDHKKIDAWRKKQAVERTRQRRPDLLRHENREIS